MSILLLNFLLAKERPKRVLKYFILITIIITKMRNKPYTIDDNILELIPCDIARFRYRYLVTYSVLFAE